MSPVEKIINDYEEMRGQFANAINAAGGAAEHILVSSDWRAVMATLVANKIVIQATYIGGKDVQN